MKNGGLHTFKLCGFGLRRWKDQSGPERGKSDHPALMNAKTGANEEGENQGETHVVTAIAIRPRFPLTQQCHYSANNNPSPYPPPSYPQRSSLIQP